MKRLFFTIILAIVLSAPVSANPVMPQSLISEIYFEDDEWYLVVYNYVLEVYGIQSFQEVGIYTSGGAFVFKENFLPDWTNSLTVITKNALVNPVQLNREVGYIQTIWWGGYVFMDLKWGNNYNYRVFGPNPGQSLVVGLVYETYNFYPEFWLVKRSAPSFLGGSGTAYGIFDGYLLDQNANPVDNAELRYVDDYYYSPPEWFLPIITNQDGYFYKNYMEACNYRIHQIVIDGIGYDFDQYITIEPGVVNTYNFSILITNIPETDKPTIPEISNFPNPFSGKTTFIINTDKNQDISTMQVTISDMSGRTISIIALNAFEMKNRQIKINWTNSRGLASGTYLLSLIDSGKIIATSKMTIE